MTAQNLAMEWRPTWYQRLHNWFAPRNAIPYADVPEGYGDALYIGTVTRLSFVDRIRVLITGVVHIQTRTWIDRPIEKYETTAVFDARG